MPTFFKLQSFFSLSLYQLIESQKVIQMEGQQEDNQTRNNLQQQAGMQKFAKKTYGKKVLLHRFFTSQHINKFVYI